MYGVCNGIISDKFDRRDSADRHALPDLMLNEAGSMIESINRSFRCLFILAIDRYMRLSILQILCDLHRGDRSYNGYTRILHVKDDRADRFLQFLGKSFHSDFCHYR